MVGYYRLKELGFRLPSGAHVLPRDMVEPLSAATEIVEEAERSAAAIVADAREAREAEKRRGYEEGLAEARLASAERLLCESATLDRRLAELEQALADIVVSSVRRLIHTFDDRTKAQTLVRAALKQMRREKKAELRVSTAQYEEMRRAIGDIVKDFPEIELVDVVEDPILVAPEVIVQTAIGRVEGDLGRNLAELEAALRRSALPAPTLPSAEVEPAAYPPKREAAE